MEEYGALVLGGVFVLMAIIIEIRNVIKDNKAKRKSREQLSLALAEMKQR